MTDPSIPELARLDAEVARLTKERDELTRELATYRTAVTDQLHFDMASLLTGTPESRLRTNLASAVANHNQTLDELHEMRKERDEARATLVRRTTRLTEIRRWLDAAGILDTSPEAMRIDELAKERDEARAEVERWRNCFVCPECGRCAADEDGCCATCGRDCIAFEAGRIAINISDHFDALERVYQGVKADRDEAQVDDRLDWAGMYRQVAEERDRLAQALLSRQRMSDGVEPVVGQRVVTVREVAERWHLGHAHDDRVHEITSLLGGYSHLVECGPQQIGSSMLRLAPEGSEVTCPNCLDWRDQMARMKIDAEVFRRTQFDTDNLRVDRDSLAARLVVVEPVFEAAVKWRGFRERPNTDEELGSEWAARVRLLNAIDAAIRTVGCSVSLISSRVCERGTRSCVASHASDAAIERKL